VAGVELRSGYQEGHAGGGGHEAGGDGEDVGEAFDGAEGDYVEGLGDVLGAGVLYIDVRQCKGAGDLAEECGFLLVGFDEGEGDVGGPEFYRNPGEAGAGTEVGKADREAIRKAVLATKDFDKGAAKKFVIDPHGTAKKAA